MPAEPREIDTVRTDGMPLVHVSTATEAFRGQDGGMATHDYETSLEWTGSTAAGYRAYDRAHAVTVGATPMTLSADAPFRGDPSLPNPEQLLLAAASSCQLLSFLALAALERVDVIRYEDSAHAVMPQGDGPTRITEITLRPTITVRGTDEGTARALLERAHEQCYIANTLTADVQLDASIEVAA